MRKGIPRKVPNKGVYIPFKLSGGGRVKQLYVKGNQKYIKEGSHFVKIKAGRVRTVRRSS